MASLFKPLLRGQAAPKFAGPEAAIRNQKWVLASRPEGAFRASDLKLVEEELFAEHLAEDEVIVAVEMLSIDAFIRTMLDAEAYHGSIPIGGTVLAIGFGKVVATRSRKFRIGDRVSGAMFAQTYAKLPVKDLMKTIALPGTTPSATLGVLGLTTGMTAWVGVNAVATPPRRKEVVVVSGAAGACGSCAVQFARNRGARVIGIAGGPKKVEYLAGLGVEGIDYKGGDVGSQLDALAPDGVDFYFDTVGGATLDAVLKRIRPKGRVVICGATSQYSGKLNKGKVDGPQEYLKLAERGATMVGFNVMQKLHLLPWMLLRILLDVWRGRVTLSECVMDGIQSFPTALETIFNGGHVGKLLVKVS